MSIWKRSSPPREQPHRSTTDAWDPAAEVAPAEEGRPVIAMAGGPVFSFRYTETTELLTAAGAEVVTFDPLHDPLPEATSALYLGGGFPELHAEALSANEALREQVAAEIAGGLPVVAECAGLLYLCRELDGHTNDRRPPGEGADDEPPHARLPHSRSPRRQRLSSTRGAGCMGMSSTARRWSSTATSPAAWYLPGGSRGLRPCADPRLLPPPPLDGDPRRTGPLRGGRKDPRGAGEMSLVLGIGLRASTSYRELRDLVHSALAGLEPADVTHVITVEGREAEPGLQRLAASLGASLVTATKQELSQQPVPTPSDQVDRLAGTASVAEAAVILSGAELVVPKRASKGATVAVGRLRATAAAPGYPPGERDVVHRVLAERRDVRRGFVD